MPIEASLQGVVVVSDRCGSAIDQRDFPIPNRNLVTRSTLPEALKRILNNFLQEQTDQSDLRAVYQRLGPDTLASYTKRFIYNKIVNI